jgi:hypothetical protein
MTRTLVALTAVLALTVSAASAAPPAGKGKPDKPGKSAAGPGQSVEKNAAKRCKAERERLGDRAFADKYGTNPNKANAFGRCVSGSAEQDDGPSGTASEQARENAAKKCQAEREQLGAQAFREKYGTNPNKANAFGKCVSKRTKKATTS